jgi:hypothetical protein
MTMLTLELHTIFSAVEIKNGRKSMQISLQLYLFEISDLSSDYKL